MTVCATIGASARDAGEDQHQVILQRVEPLARQDHRLDLVARRPARNVMWLNPPNAAEI